MVHRTVYNVDVHRLITIFGRCVLSGLLAGGALRNKSAVDAAARVSSSLDSFVACSHSNDGLLNAAPSHNHCMVCSTEPLFVSNHVEESMSSAGRLTRAISEVALMKSRSNLRDLTKAVYSVLKCAVWTRNTFFEKLNEIKPDDAVNYNVIN